MDDIKTKALEKLNAKQTNAFMLVLKEASGNKFLGGDEEDVIPKKRCIVVLYGVEELPIGFYTPKKQNYKGKDHWRAGTLFIQKAYQGKGIMSSVLEEFFSTHQPALSWIEDKNTVSVALFKGLDFVQGKATTYEDQPPGHWWLKEKLSTGNECAEYSW